jgi:hypothetical protein
MVLGGLLRGKLGSCSDRSVGSGVLQDQVGPGVLQDRAGTGATPQYSTGLHGGHSNRVCCSWTGHELGVSIFGSLRLQLVQNHFAQLPNSISQRKVL